jgi:hypothetical protein
MDQDRLLPMAVEARTYKCLRCGEKEMGIDATSIETRGSKGKRLIGQSGSFWWAGIGLESVCNARCAAAIS